VLAIELDARLIEFLQERFPVNAEGRVTPAPGQNPENSPRRFPRNWNWCMTTR
jgi:hypothetical protein